MMQIGAPQTKQHEGRHAFVSKITVDKQEIDFPETLWFSLRGDPSYEYPELSDAFLVGMLPIAMKLGESISVEGQVSEQLAYGLQTYQSILNCWWPETFKCIEIDYAELVDRRGEIRPAGVGCCFSGGVDSFYTVLKHLPGVQPLPGYQLTHALAINGFTQLYDFKGDGTSTQFYKNYHVILENWGVKLLMLDTNIRLFRKEVLTTFEAHNSFIPIFSACAHSIGNLLGKFIIPGFANYEYSKLIPNGYHPAMDHHFGTDQLQIIHHADNQSSRIGKIEYMIDVPEIQQNLRICLEKLWFDEETGQAMNCGKCRKCIRMIITLELLGKNDSFKLIENRSDIQFYKNPDILSGEIDIFLQDLLDLSKKKKNREWRRILEKAIRKNKDSIIQKTISG